MVGGSTGPDAGSCGDWDYVSSACEMCNDVMGTCSTDTECCAALTCRRGFSFSTPRCCVEAGDTCSAGGDCCGYMDCGGSGTCECRLGGLGRGCFEDGDCCGTSTCTGGGDMSGICIL